MWNSTFFKHNLNQSLADIQVHLAVKLLTVMFLKKPQLSFRDDFPQTARC